MKMASNSSITLDSLGDVLLVVHKQDQKKSFACLGIRYVWLVPSGKRCQTLAGRFKAAVWWRPFQVFGRWQLCYADSALRSLPTNIMGVFSFAELLSLATICVRMILPRLCWLVFQINWELMLRNIAYSAGRRGFTIHYFFVLSLDSIQLLQRATRIGLLGSRWEWKAFAWRPKISGESDASRDDDLKRLARACFVGRGCQNQSKWTNHPTLSSCAAIPATLMLAKLYYGEEFSIFSLYLSSLELLILRVLASLPNPL